MTARPDSDAAGQSRPIRVLQVLEATTGGTAQHLHDLVTGLRPLGIAPSVVCSVDRDPAFLPVVEQMCRADTPVHIVPMQRRPAPLADTRAVRAIMTHLRQGPVDIVHAHSAKAGFLARAAAHRVEGVRIMYTPHVFPFQMQTRAWQRRLYRWLERYAARWTDVTVCVSREEARIAGRLGSRTVAYIPNGVPVPAHDGRDGATPRLAVELGLPEDSLLVGAIGRLTRQKGPPVLIEAVAALRGRHPGVHVALIGDGELRPSLEAHARRHGIHDHVHFLGRRRDATVLAGRIDVLAMPSLWEGLPYALLDAMAAATPVVASRVGGIPDAVTDGETGLLVPPGDAAGLADAIASLAAAPDRRRRLGAAARACVHNRFTLTRMLADTADLYRRTAS